MLRQLHSCYSTATHQSSVILMLSVQHTCRSSRTYQSAYDRTVLANVDDRDKSAVL